MSFQDWYPEFVLIKELIKTDKFEQAQKNMEYCLDEIRQIDTYARRIKVDEINISIFKIKQDIERIEGLINRIQKEHSVDLLGIRQSLNSFKDEVNRLRREKKKNSSHR